MPELLIDTDVVVDHLRGVRRLSGVVDSSGSYSVITRAELFAGNAAEHHVITQLLRPLQELLVTRAIAERAGRIRRAADVALPDALIAASALEHGLHLVTRNVKHFGRVADLTVHAPDDVSGSNSIG